MKNVLKVIAGAVLLAGPMVADAQVALDPVVSVSIAKDSPFKSGGRGYGTSGGGLFANFTVDFPDGPRTFSDYLIWCIDAGRGVSLPGTYNFQLFTLKDFALTNFGSIDTGHDPDLADMRRIASLNAQMVNDFPVNRNLYQGSIWSIFDGYTTYGNQPSLGTILPGNPNFASHDYYVLWNGAQQTFLVQIPEPSTTGLLLLAGLGAMLAVVRRRNMA